MNRRAPTGSWSGSTQQGPIDIDVRREWAPRGADRFYNLVELVTTMIRGFPG